MKIKYTDEKNALILISLLKKNNIRRVIISPGTSNVCFAGSLVNDSFFELISAVDERSAAYMACGIAAETGDPVVLSCTGATSSRNYMPGLTEAFYRKLPILAVTSSQRSIRIGHDIDQVTDRTLLPRDIAKISVQMPVIFDSEMEWACMISANKAILELKHNGGGPVHINLETNYSRNFNIQDLPNIRHIRRFCKTDIFPLIPEGKIAIVVGNHALWSDDLIRKVDEFCEKYNSLVICDHTSKYIGKYKILANAFFSQMAYESPLNNFELIIHLGEITGSKYNITTKHEWRVNLDGEIRDTYKHINCVFECDEEFFFSYYVKENITCNTSYYKQCKEEYNTIINSIPELPLSNLWLAKETSHLLPEKSVLHLAIRNSLRAWNYFEIPSTVLAYSNTGGFGIDGCLSSMIGASLCNKDKIYYCVIGDLAFFYDMNVLGNRHISNNVRILLVNNGTAMEMQYKSNLTSLFENGLTENSYLAASGHFGNKSRYLVKDYAENLGFYYYSVSNKNDFQNILPLFVSTELTDKPILIEVFTNTSDEELALQLFSNAISAPTIVLKNNIKNMIKGTIGEKIINAIRS